MSKNFFIRLQSSSGQKFTAKLLGPLTCFCILLGFCLVLSVFFHTQALAWKGMAAEVINGCTIRVQHGHSLETVHLYGINCPALNEPFGEESRDFTEHLVLGKPLEIKPLDKSSPKIKALVFIPKEEDSVNEMLIKAGWAWMHQAYCEKAVLCGRWETMQGEAEREKKGIWSVIPENVPPWRWLEEQQR